ncbi:MAG: hypothetical protein RBR77_14285 [Thauera sp.]|nr:hypothetical protein [Thauera sp.]
MQNIAMRDQRNIKSGDHTQLVGAFDAARSADPGINTWALSEALSGFHLGGWDDAAIGGDLAYQYGKNGTLSGVSAVGVLAILEDSALGTAMQLSTGW